jgi:hypothetical protein
MNPSDITKAAKRFARKKYATVPTQYLSLAVDDFAAGAEWAIRQMEREAKAEPTDPLAITMKLRGKA